MNLAQIKEEYDATFNSDAVLERDLKKARIEGDKKKVMLVNQLLERNRKWRVALDGQRASQSKANDIT